MKQANNDKQTDAVPPFASVPGYARFGLPRSVLVRLSAAVGATQTIRYCRSQGYRLAEIVWLDTREHMRRSARQELAAHNNEAERRAQGKETK